MPFIPYKTREKYNYVYDTNHNSILKISEEQYEALVQINKGVSNDFCQNILKDFRKKGFLLDSGVKKIEHPDTKDLKYKLDRYINAVTFQISQNCNLQCCYCPYADNEIYNQRSHISKNMDWSTLKKSIDFLVEHSKDSDSLFITFYGGEPLFSKDLIIQAMDYTIDKIHGKVIHFGITTNGTLLDDTFAKRIKDYNIIITISLDGPEEIHDKNRTFASGRGSFKVVYENIKNIKENYPELFSKIKYNCVISPETDYRKVWDFFRNNNDICSLSKASFSTLSNNYTDQNISYDKNYFAERNYEKLKAYLCLLGKLKDENILDYEYEITRILIYKEEFKPRAFIPEVAHPAGTCVPGLKKLFINVNGDFFPCEKANEDSPIMKIGNIETGFDIDKVKEVMNVGATTEDTCKECWAFNCCSICPIMADNGKDEHYSSEYKLRKCAEVKAGALDNIKNYTMLKELKYQFREEDLR